MDNGQAQDRVPPVVAVVVTRDPGPWFEEALGALGAQDYADLSVLVLVSGGDEDPTGRVAAALPGAYVRRLDADLGYGAATDEALAMIEGAAFLLLCHDDCAPEPNALGLLVEEAFRSNAGVVSPKMVRWDDPTVLVHVGMNVDKTGAVVERVQPGEVDHGQHDAIRDVFCVAGGFTLVRADLFRELGGFDPGIVAMGEDLDLCWRAQVAGSRVLVVPDARVRHLEAVAGRLRAPATLVGERRPATLQSLQRRHELRAVLKCYSPFHLARVLPQAALLGAGEIVVSAFSRDTERVGAVWGAWTWNLRRRKELRRLRRELKAHRRYPDPEVRALQLRGSACLSTYLSRLIHEDLETAQGRVAAATVVAGAHGAEEPLLTGSVGVAFSEDVDFDELDDLGRRSGRDRFGRRRRVQILATRATRLVAWLAAVLVLVFGTRLLLGGALPTVGQFAPFPSWTDAWHQLLSAWQTPGFGTSAPTTPAFGVLGLFGTFTFGSMGFLQKVIVLGCVPLGAFGLARLLRPLCSPRARLIGTLAYLALPLAYNDLASGRLDGLVAYATVPWLCAGLLRASGLAPFDRPEGPGWRHSLIGRAAAVGVVEAVAVAFAPAVAIDVLLVGGGIVVGSLVVGGAGRSLRALGAAAVATAVAAVLCAPWVIGVVWSGRAALSVFGLRDAPWTAPSWADLLRFAVGPTGGGALSWFLVAAGLLPLLVGRAERLAWAGRLWVVAVGAWALALVSARGWAGPFAPSVTVLLVPAAVGVAAGVALGVASFETDLATFSFGWRQVASLAAISAAVVGAVPVIAASGGGRWGLVTTGYEQPVGLLSAPPSTGSTGPVPAYRVLWLGDPRALPTGGWSIAPGLAYATAEEGVPQSVDVWSPASPGPAAGISTAVELARDGRTRRLGQLLAPASIRYIVVVQTLAPVIGGLQTPTAYPAPADLVPALERQGDLQAVPTPAAGFTVFANAGYMPERAARAVPGPTAGSGSAGGSGAIAVGSWTPVLAGPSGAHSYSGPVSAGTVFSGYAPAGSWQLTAKGAVSRTAAFGWASQFSVPPGQATLQFSAAAWLELGLFAQLVVWLAVLAAFVRPRWRRRRRTAEGSR